jgi:hypothetical protein
MKAGTFEEKSHETFNFNYDLLPDAKNLVIRTGTAGTETAE